LTLAHSEVTPELVDRLFREESGRVVATLIRGTGDFDLAEEAVQDAFLTAIERWPRDGLPDNPGAWITTTARNRAIDKLRRQGRLTEKAERLRREAVVEAEGSGDVEAIVHGPVPALARMDAVVEPLDDYSYLHASRADMLRRLRRTDEARAAYERALQLSGNASERRFLQRRLDGLARPSGT